MRLSDRTSVEADVLCEAVLRAMREQDVTWSELARRLDYWRQRPDRPAGQLRPDATRAKRLVGYRAWGGTKHSARARRIRARYALSVCRALHIDPVDVGL